MLLAFLIRCAHYSFRNVIDLVLCRQLSPSFKVDQRKNYASVEIEQDTQQSKITKYCRRQLTWYVVFLCLTQTACLRTELSVDQPKEISRLVRVNNRQLEYRVSSVFDETIVGHQFVLGVIPFGRVTIPSPSGIVEKIFITEAALLGFQPRQRSVEASPRLVIEVLEISVSGYDFIFFRRPSASVQIKMSLFDSSGFIRRSVVAVGSETTFAKFAFDRELSGVFEEAATVAIRRGINEMGLNS